MKIGILTSFNSMMDFYSLTSVVRTQIRMIQGSGHEAVLLVQDDFSTDHPIGCEVRKAIPAHHKTDYLSLKDVTNEDMAQVQKIAHQISNHIPDLDAILAHDLIFTGWHLLINMALQQVTQWRPGPWFHWVHSVPGGSRDYWRLPANSWLVYPNSTDRIRCAEQFQTWPDRVLVIPHCVDVRDLYVKDPIAEELITKYDLCGAELVQVYPIPTDRIEAKGVADTIRMFGMFKKLGRSVCLIIPNAWCTIDKLRNKVSQMMDLADEYGLTDREVVFTSRARPDLEVGLPLSAIADLTLCQNVFVCPTQSETFGLSLAEAALSGALLILNEDLPMHQDVVGGHANAIWAKFSSSFQHTRHKDRNRYLEDIAKIALNEFDHSPALRSRTHYRQAYRREAVWQALEGAILRVRSGANAKPA